jgi:type VI secretion system secreted protein VgrG
VAEYLSALPFYQDVIPAGNASNLQSYRGRNAPLRSLMDITSPLVDKAIASANTAADAAIKNATAQAGALVSSAREVTQSALTQASELRNNITGGISNATGQFGNLIGNVPDFNALDAQLDALGVFADIKSLLQPGASPFTQTNRLITLELGAGTIAGEHLNPLTVTGSEALGEQYSFYIKCLAHNANIELKTLLGLPARLGFLTGAGQRFLRCGIVTRAEALPADGGAAFFGLTFEPPTALLRHRRTSRVFQDKTVPEIVKEIFDEHIANNSLFGANFAHRFDLLDERVYPSRSYCLQYRETDADFVDRLLKEEGINYRFEHSEVKTSDEYAAPATFNDRPANRFDQPDWAIPSSEEGTHPLVTFVAFDDPYSLPQASQGTIRYHRANATEADDTFIEWTSVRQLGASRITLSSYEYKNVTTLSTFSESQTCQGELGEEAQSTAEVFDIQTHYYGDQDNLERYARLRQDASDRRKKSFAGKGTVRQLQAGDWFELAGHPQLTGLQEEREFIVERLTLAAHNNLPVSNKGKDAPPPYQISIEAHRRGIPLTPDYSGTRHAKPTAHGNQTATVVGPPQDTSGAVVPMPDDVYTDNLGRIKIQFHWQRPAEHRELGAAWDEKSSCWVRVSYPSAGAGWGCQLIPRIGQECLVSFIENDIDRPIVTGVVHNGSHMPPRFSGEGNLPANRALSGIKTKEHEGQQYGELLFDDTPGEVRTKLSSEHGKTQLNQGFLTHPREDGIAEPRGDGFELRTDRTGALRAAEGLYLTAHARLKARGRQLDRDEIVAQLELGLAIAKDLGRHAETHHADETNTVEQERLLRDVRQWEDGSNTAKNAPVKSNKAILAATAPDGIALSSENNITSVAGSTHDQVSGKDSNLTVGQHLRMRIGQTLSIFVQYLGMKLIAAAGKIQIQAQSDEVEIGAAKKLHLWSLEEIVLEAPKITLRAQAAGTTWSTGMLTQTTGDYVVHASNHTYLGPASVAAQLPGMPSSTLKTNELIAFAGRSGKAIPNVKYEIKNQQGKAKGAGGSDATGATTEVTGKVIEPLKAHLKFD